MPIYDFYCEKCNVSFEEIVPSDVMLLDESCPRCGGTCVRKPCAPAVLTEIIPSYPGSLKQKAGYVHTHGDRPATKVQSGPGGCVNPK